MAISTYEELKTAIASWLGRDDLSATIPDFITLFEAAAARKLRVRPMETSVIWTPVNGAVPLPSDFLGMRRLTWTGSTPVELSYVHPTYLRSLFPGAEAGIPSHYTVEASNILIRPVDDTDVDILYYARTPAVSGALNWLLTSHPDAYLFGSLAEAHGFNIDPDQLALWKGRRDEVFDEISKLEFRERANMSVRVIGATP